MDGVLSADQASLHGRILIVGGNADTLLGT